MCEACEPQCDGKECGSDQCGSVCGSCASQWDACTAGVCIACEPQCDGKACGDDSCGSVCGLCGDEQTCNDGQCLDCVPDCKGKVCGSDGCGGECGSCPVDCDQIPTGPFSLNKLSGPMASEDLAFDDAGNVVGSNDNAIFKSPYGQSPQLWVPNIYFRAGLRFISTGDLMVNNDNTGQLLRVEPDGTVHVTLSNLAYPNGLAADRDGYIFVTEHDAKRVLRVEPYSQQVDTISNGLISNPNGVAFNPDYSMMFVAGFSGVGTIYAFPIEDNGDIGDAFSWATNVGSGWLDGIGLDICGNLYIADYSATKIYRFGPGGGAYTTVVTGGGGVYLPNMQWGSGYGGWDEFKMYLPDGWNKGVFEVDVGVPGISRAWPPPVPADGPL